MRASRALIMGLVACVAAGLSIAASAASALIGTQRVPSFVPEQTGWSDASFVAGGGYSTARTFFYRILFLLSVLDSFMRCPVPPTGPSR